MRAYLTCSDCLSDDWTVALPTEDDEDVDRALGEIMTCSQCGRSLRTGQMLRVTPASADAIVSGASVPADDRGAGGVDRTRDREFRLLGVVSLRVKPRRVR